MSIEISSFPRDLNSLRACKLCKLIKNRDDFFQYGCDNCEDVLHMAGNKELVNSLTSPYFDGMVSILDKKHSWVANWLQKKTVVRGMYAINVTGKLPANVREELEQRHMLVPENFD